MASLYSVKIDNVSVSVESGLTFIKDGGEEFNLGDMKIVNLSQKAPYPDYADVVLTINSEEYEACIQKDLSKRTSLGIYEHTITIAEPVIKLSQYIHPDKKYTTWDGNKMTYLDQLQNLLATQELGVSTPFLIHADTQTLLDVDAVEKEYSGGDLLTTLTDMFRGVNAVPTLSLNNVIGHEEFGTLGTEITISDVISEIITSDIGDYGVAVHSKIKNGTYEGNLTTGGTFFPSRGYGVTPRSSNDKYQDAEAQWFLDSGIRRRISVQIMNLASQTLGTVVAGINDWVVSKEEWDDLETETTRSTLTAGVYKNNTIYFVEGDNVIQNAGVITNNNVSVNDTAMEGLIRSYWVKTRGTDSEYNSQNLSDIEIEWFYQPIRDMDVRVERHNLDRVVKNATIINNQKDSTLELQRYGQALKSHINRIGNDTFEITIRYTSLASFSLWNVNDYTSDGYKIVKINLYARNNSLDVTYEFTKNQSILNPLAAVNRVVSPFTISKRNVLSCYIYNEYVEFSKTQRTTTSELKLDGIKTILNALKFGSSFDNPVYIAQYFSADSSVVAVLDMSVMAIPLGQSLTFNAQFNAPKVAGYQLVADGILGHKLVPISYANSYGQVDDFAMWFGSTSVTVPDNHPVGATMTTPLMYVPTTTIELNPDEIFGLTLHQHIITDRSNLIIGDYFTENNSMIKELAIAPNVTLVHFADNPHHTIYDKVVKNVGSVLGGGSYVINTTYDMMTISGVPSGNSWAIIETTSPHRLYMAYNYDGTDMNTIYINRLKDRPDIETL